MNSSDIDALKLILENIRNPDALDTHPWVDRPFVRASISANPDDPSPGRQLVEATASLFHKMMPGTPPRHGKRLDTRWGEFGLMAAMYFAPLEFGAPLPTSLRDAWGRIDSAILLFVFGNREGSLQKEQLETYKLVGNEPDAAPSSTLSDWHRKGIQRFAEVIETHDRFLETHPSGDLVSEKKTTRRRSSVRKAMGLTFLFILLLLAVGLTFGWVKGRRVYAQARLVWDDANRIQSLAATTPSMEMARQTGSSLVTLRQDFTVLKTETEPYLWIGPWLKGMPVYGGDLASAPDLVSMVDSLLAAADTAYQAGQPLLDAIDQADITGLDTARMTQLMLDAQPQWLEARHDLDAAIATRQRIDASALSPRTRELIGKMDKFVPLMQDGITLAIEFPTLVGAGSEGPKTYLLLAQNEDELRPTGGFITAAATLLLQDGHISNLKFQNSGDLDNWERPYPAAPWQLQQYMNSPVLIFRDANWFTDFRTAALYAEYLYSYTNEHSVDGVIAFDQQMLVMVLKVIGSIDVNDAPYPIDANNVIAYMRSAKTPTAEDLASPDWNDKIFINRIVAALITRMFSGNVPWKQLSATFVEGMNQRHLVLQLDNPTLTSFLASHQWDGAVRPGDGDFLMVVDSNVGFNKTNAVVKTSLFYDVDLTNLKGPTSQLTVDHQNNAAKDIPCAPINTGLTDEKNYPIDRCYWDYLRVYVPSGSDVLGATAQSIPAEWMIRNRPVPPQVDVLDEKIEGIQGFGTLKVVPGGESLATSFRFSLPASIVEKDSVSGDMIYRLKIQKQPGTSGVPITLRLHLPNGAAVKTLPAGAVLQGQNIQIEAALVTDFEVEVVFTVP